MHVGLIEQQVTIISLVSSSTLSRISRPSLDICRLWRCMEVLRCYWTHLWISKRSVPGRFTRRKMALLWWKYVSLLAIAMPLWLVLLQVRIKSSPTNVSPQHRFDEIARSKQHCEKRVTRSQTVRTDNEIVPQDIPETEIARTNDNGFLSETLNPGLVSPMSCATEPTSVLDPLVSPFTPTGLCLTSSDPAPTGVEDEVLPAPRVSFASCQDVESTSVDSVSSVPCSQESDTDDGDLGVHPSLHSDAGVVHDDRNTTRLSIDGSAVVTKVGLGNGKPGCQNYSCMYGGGLSRDDIDYIYKCLKCEGPHTSSICVKCMLNGGCCEPGHENWELIT